MVKIVIPTKLKGTACNFKFGLSSVKYEQHVGQNFPTISSTGEPLKQFFMFRESPKYEKVYRPENIIRGECNSIISKLLSRKLICKELSMYVNLYCKKNFKNFPVFLYYLIFLTPSVASYRTKNSTIFRGIFGIFAV
jgi:hypothetical protein